jgi:outer membrane usher protein
MRYAILKMGGEPARLRVTTVAAGLLFAIAGMAHAGQDQDKTEDAGRVSPQATAKPVGSMTLYLELVVNALPSGQVVQVQSRDGAYCVRAGDLDKVSVRTGQADTDQWIDLSKLDGVKVEYDSVDQRLNLTVPTGWLPEQTVGSARLFDRTPARESSGLLFNYDIYTADPTIGPGYTSAWLEQRLLQPWGTISNTGVYHDGFGAASVNASGNNRYLRYDTTWTYSDQDRMITYTAGDLITGALSWSNAVRLGGVSIARDFSVRPDIVTYPLPQFAGQAAVPTAVDLFINGSKATTGQVAPGPFTMNNVPFISGAGEATVVTTDALGRQVATTIPFYVANTLLQKGLTDYSLSIGAIRRNYGIDSLSYGLPALSASGRYGLTDHLTIEAHAEGGEQLGLGGLGVDVGVGQIGVFSASVAQSRLGGTSGRQYTVGYNYASQHVSLSLQRTQRTSGFRDLSVYDLPAGTTYALERSITQATAALNLGSGWGSIGAGYFDVESADSLRTRIANLSYSRPLFGRTTLYAALNKTFNGSIGAQLELIIPFGGNGTVTASAQHTGAGWAEGAQYTRSVPTDGGLGGNLAYLGGDSQYQQADITWRNRYFQIGGGVYGYGTAGSGYNRWAELQGSVVAMDGAIMPANRVTDSFVLVSTQGQKDVPVSYENQLIGTTDSHGHVLVPWVPSFYAAKYEIDPLNLPTNDEAPVLEQHIAVRRGAGAVVTFPITKIVAAQIALVDEGGQPLKIGASVMDNESGQQAVVGWGGQTYLEGLRADNHLTVTRADGKVCHATFKLDVNASETSRVGPLVCTE